MFGALMAIEAVEVQVIQVVEVVDVVDVVEVVDVVDTVEWFELLRDRTVEVFKYVGGWEVELAQVVGVLDWVSPRVARGWKVERGGDSVVYEWSGGWPSLPLDGCSVLVITDILRSARKRSTCPKTSAACSFDALATDRSAGAQPSPHAD